MALKERRTLILDEFKGVDFSSSPLDVAPTRAADAVNFINEYGRNVKRKGWKELFCIENDERVPQRINGVYRYKEKMIVHAGVSFYEIAEIGGQYIPIDISESCTYTDAALDLSRIRDQRSWGVVYKDRLYIIGAGDYLVYGSWDEKVTYELRRVYNNEDTYIPTTTININCDGTTNDIKGTLDAPNLLCDRRINSLVGTSNNSATWTLDAPIEEGSEVKVRVEKFDENGEATEKIYINAYSKKGADGAEDEEVKGDTVLYLYKEGQYGADEEIEVGGSIDWFDGKITLNFETKTTSNIDNIYVTFKPYKVESKTRTCIFTGKYYSAVASNDRDRIPFVAKLISPIREGGTVNVAVILNQFQDDIEYSNQINRYDYRTEKHTTEVTNHLYLKKTYSVNDKIESVGDINFTTGEITFYVKTQYKSGSLHIKRNNVTITYHPATEKAEKPEDVIDAERINNCSFGIMFGAYGNTDRLFVGGNNSFPNLDYYSESENLTYFTEASVSAVGSNTSAICGYARLSDGMLAIYKDGAGGGDATIYYRTGRRNEYTDAEGNVIEEETVFPLSAGTIGEAAVSHFTCANLAGDNIILSKNGVFGIVLNENIKVDDRFVRERSRLINKRLCSHKGLSDAAAVIFNNRYYLSVDGVCYIADSRYKYRGKGDVDGSYNYEWWYFDNIPARVWETDGESLYFGTADGKMCVFDDEYTDRSSFVTEAGDLGFSIADKKITFNTAISDRFDNGDELIFLSPKVYSLFKTVDGDAVKDSRIYTSFEELFDIYDGTEVYVDNVGDSGLEVGVKYHIHDVDAGSCSYRLSYDGEDVLIASGGFRLHRCISGRELCVSQKGESVFYAKEKYGEGVHLISDYGGELPSDIICRFTHKRPIAARWYTPTLDLGTNMAQKTLLGVSVTAEGRISFGYDCGHTKEEWAVQNAGRISFENLSFEDFSFDNGFDTSHTVRLNRRNINYIRFCLLSEAPEGCSVHKLSVLYKINKNNRGIL